MVLLSCVCVCVCVQTRMVEAICIVNELTNASNPHQPKFIAELSDRARVNPLFPNLVNIARGEGVTELEQGVCVCV